MNFFLNDPYLVTYENILSDSLCDSIVKKYNYVLKNEKEKIDKLSICYKDGNKLCTSCNCTRMNLMEHSLQKISQLVIELESNHLITLQLEL